MKITIDTKTGELKAGGKTFNDCDKYKKEEVIKNLRKYIIENSKLSDYEHDCMWMSYRYCIGRHTIASSMHANDIWQNCKGRMSEEKQLFTAYDINREIERCLQFYKPYFHFPLTNLNRIYTSAVDIVLQFMEDYEIKSVEDFIKYRDVNIILSDNERGYKIETVTWEEYLRPRILKLMQEAYNNYDMSEDFAWNHYQMWLEKRFDWGELSNKLEKITAEIPNKEHYFLNDLEDLFVWNDLVHCFDFEHYHKSILIDGTECNWFWSWTDNTEEREPNKFYKTFGYHRIRVPVDKWNGNYSCYIPDESIKENIF